MPVRTFDGVDDRVVCALGSTGFAFGNGTVAAVVRRARDIGTEVVLRSGASGTSAGRYGLEIATTSLQARAGNSVVLAPSIVATVAMGWVLLVVSKASGTAAPRFHRYVFATGVWTHENGATSIADSTAPASGPALGANPNGSSPFGGDLGIAAIWNRVLSDVEVETLVSEAAWTTTTPVALWPLNQASTATAVQDTIGAADQSALTGTTVTATAVPWVSAGESDTVTMAVVGATSPNTAASSAAAAAAVPAVSTAGAASGQATAVAVPAVSSTAIALSQASGGLAPVVGDAAGAAVAAERATASVAALAGAGAATTSEVAVQASTTAATASSTAAPAPALVVGFAASSGEMGVLTMATVAASAGTLTIAGQLGDAVVTTSGAADASTSAEMATVTGRGADGAAAAGLSFVPVPVGGEGAVSAQMAVGMITVVGAILVLDDFAAEDGYPGFVAGDGGGRLAGVHTGRLDQPLAGSAR